MVDDAGDRVSVKYSPSSSALGKNITLQIDDRLIERTILRYLFPSACPPAACTKVLGLSCNDSIRSLIYDAELYLSQS